MLEVSPVQSDARRLSMVVIGDSLAYGLGAAKQEQGLTQRFFAHIRSLRPGSTYANHAVPHATMGDVLRHQVPRLQGAQADIVVLIAGANDLRYTLDRFVFARRFRHLLGAVHDAAPNARLIVGGMPDVTQTEGVPRLMKPPVQRMCRRLNETMRRIAGVFGDAFLDLFLFTNAPLCSDVTYLCDDGYHPNDFGYGEITQRALPVISEVLRSLDTASTVSRDDDPAGKRSPS